MPKLPNLSGRQIVKALYRLGYKEIRQKGSHIRLDCPGKKRVTVPNYKSIDKSLLMKILRDAELTPEEFLEFLKKSPARRDVTQGTKD